MVLQPYLKINQHEFVLPGIGIGGAGLCNALWLWAKMVIAHKQTGFPMLWPTWRKMKPGAFFRGEYAHAYSPNYFKKTSAYERKYFLKALGYKTIPADEILEQYRLQEFSGQSVILEFSKRSDPFESFFDQRRLVRKEFEKISGLQVKGDDEQVVSVHIRRGDFCFLDIAPPLDAFSKRMNTFKAKLGGNVKFRIFSDAKNNDSEFWDFVPTNAEVVQRGSAMDDLMSLVSSQYMIGTAASSYSRMAAYLGNMDVLWCGGDDQISRLQPISYKLEVI